MWQQLLRDKEKLSKINETGFTMIDSNSDGAIQRNELQEVMNICALEMGLQKPSKQQIKEVMKELDKEGKGYLNKEDFMVLVAQVVKLMSKMSQFSRQVKIKQGDKM